MLKAKHKAGWGRDTMTGLAWEVDVDWQEVCKRKAGAGEIDCSSRDGTSAQKGTKGLELQPLVENILKAEQQELVQGLRQVQLRKDQKQPALQEGPECAASQVLQRARSVLQGEQ